MVSIVTGGSGFIGSRLVRALKERGEDVINIDLSAGRDLLDVELLLKLCKEHKPTAIYHLAANKNARATGEEATSVLEVNVAGSASLLYALYSNCMDSIKRFVFASTGGALFDIKQGEKAKPDDKPTPKGIYGFSKLVDEYIFSGFSKTYNDAGIEFSTLRLANVYGWEIRKHKNVVAKWLELAYKGETLKVYNTLDMYRDYVYVDDVVEAFLKAPRGVWHISTGEPRSLAEVISIISKVMGKEPMYEIIKTNSSSIEVNYSALDPSSAKDWWKPKTTFEAGVEKTYKEMLDYFNE